MAEEGIVGADVCGLKAKTDKFEKNKIKNSETNVLSNKEIVFAA